jgi:hypothetical protein
LSDGAVLGLVALTLALIIAGLFRLAAVLDDAELALRRLVAGVWAARRAVAAAGELGAAIERDAASGQAALDRLAALKRGRSRDPGGAGPVSLPLRPGRSPLR